MATPFTNFTNPAQAIERLNEIVVAQPDAEEVIGIFDYLWGNADATPQDLINFLSACAEADFYGIVRQADETFHIFTEIYAKPKYKQLILEVMTQEGYSEPANNAGHAISIILSCAYDNTVFGILCAAVASATDKITAED